MSRGTYKGLQKFWDFDDITQYGRVHYIEFVAPVVLTLGLSMFVVQNIARHYYRYDILKQKKTSVIEELLLDEQALGEELNRQGEHEEVDPLLPRERQTSQYQSLQKYFSGDDSLKEKHFSIERIQPIKTNGRPHGNPIIVKRDFLEKSRVIIEFLLVGFEVMLQLYRFLHLSSTKKEFMKQSSSALFIEWCFLLFVVAARLVNINDDVKWVNLYPGNLWSVSFFAYMIIFFTYILPFRSVLIGNITDKILQRYYITQTFVTGALFLNLFTARIGNHHAILYDSGEGVYPSPEPVASIATFIGWSWLDKMVWKAHQVTLEKGDVWGLVMEDYSMFVVKRFDRFKQKFATKRHFSTFLFIFFSKYLLLQAFWAALDGIITFIPTILLKRILEYVDDPTTASANLAWFYVFGMLACRIFVAITQAQALFFGRRVCIRLKSIIISEVYSKALRRSVAANNKFGDEEPNKADANQDNDTLANLNDGDKESSEKDQTSNIGAIINLMAVDAFKVSEICAYLHTFIEAMVMSVVAFSLLYKLLGYAAIVGILIVIGMIPINFKLVSLMGKYQKKALGITDKRIQKLNEALQAIRIIKFFSWEDNFFSEIDEIREAEIQMYINKAYAWAFSAFIWFLTPTIVTGASFTVYIYVQKQVLTAPVAFTALALFQLLKQPLDQLSNMLSYVIQSKVSLDRVQNFLDEEDTQKYNQLKVAPDGNKLAFENATIAWSNNNQDFKLKDLDINFKIGKLNVVIGPTGSGKTSLLLALLGEMQLLSGRIVVPSLDARHEMLIDSDGMTNSIAYCSQSAWLLNDTVRNNILFYSPYNEDRYKEVIIACGLKRDFELFDAGDQTEIGEKGITLSGGQKQRISLARALYSNCRHLLLDDCLSAVDSHTAAWIYDNCITGPLMEGRTCVLVSHNIALTLKNAELVVMLENGRITNRGDPISLLKDGILGEDELVKSSILSGNNSTSNFANSSADLRKMADESNARKPEESENPDLKKGKLIMEETKSEGVVGKDVYLWYLNVFGGWKIMCFLLLIFITTQMVQISQSWWVRAWVSRKLKVGLQFWSTNKLFTTNVPLLELKQHWLSTGTYLNSNVSPLKGKSATHTTLYYLSIYFAIGITQALFAGTKTVINFVAGINASRRIFKKLLSKVLHSRLRFIDSTPIGRIMNRFSKDIEAVDQELTPFLEAAFFCLVQCISTIILITFITPQFLFVAVLVCVLYYLVGYFYINTSRELKRIESITKSPIYQHFSETLTGVATIRAFGDEIRFIMHNLEKIDENNKPFFYLWVANRWLAFRIDMIGALIIFGSGVFILLNLNRIDSGMAGISLTYAISFTEGALWLVRFYSTVEMNMNSVERLKEYMDVPQEPYNEGTITTSTNWPTEGKIEVKDLSLRYAENLPRVIKEVSFDIEPHNMVGIVGRTGAGKSTIITALFRFLEPETGSIKIDGIDITSIDLQTLRRSITIIPQDPTLFTGTIRSNLDPFGKYPDEEIFRVLHRVNLIDDDEMTAQSSDNNSLSSDNVNKFLNLENEITEGGNNLSQGQKQLMCLARALLRNPKVILLDEATASIDYASDAKIQQTIRNVFDKSTVLTIAHRLRSVIDYDKILVMDAGEVIEYDQPYTLLLDKNSHFYSMCEQSGELETLIDLAKKAFVKKMNAE